MIKLIKETWLPIAITIVVSLVMLSLLGIVRYYLEVIPNEYNPLNNANYTCSTEYEPYGIVVEETRDYIVLKNEYRLSVINTSTMIDIWVIYKGTDIICHYSYNNLSVEITT